MAGLTSKERNERIEIISSHVLEILEAIDEPLREGLEGTPERVARMFVDELYHRDDPLEEELKTIFVGEAFSREMVVVDHIPFTSWCEHHIVPYMGYAHVGYVPNQKIIGLSKIVRLAQAAGRGLTIQERVTTRVADAIENKLAPYGVMVVIQATHSCMVARGVKAFGCSTNTSQLRGIFRDSEAARDEFFRMVSLNGRIH